MTVRKLSAGDITEAKCTRCRSILNHTIVAMIGERIVRVQCNTCGGQHNYHSVAAEKQSREKSPTRKSSSAERPRRGALPPGPSEWVLAMEGVDPETATPYAMDCSWRKQALVNHPTFGIGIVTALLGPTKVEILFESGKKVLRCAA